MEGNKEEVWDRSLGVQGGKESHETCTQEEKRQRSCPHFPSARTDAQTRGKFAGSQSHLNRDDFPLCFLGGTLSEVCVTVGSS